MWESTVNGQVLHFRLAGINNQNFIMRDEETGTWWQQVSGEAIHGLLKGQKLHSVFHDELTFALWKQEQPKGRVLRPVETIAQAGKYATSNWEERMAAVPVTTAQMLDPAFTPRTLVVGLTVNGAAKAYPFDAVVRQSPIVDSVGGTPILIVLGEDRKSVRAYERLVDGRKLEFFLKPGTSPLRLVDAETGSEWDFTGKSTAGALSGRQLKKILVLNDYWFDWKTYNPKTEIYKLGSR